MEVSAATAGLVALLVVDYSAVWRASGKLQGQLFQRSAADGHSFLVIQILQLAGLLAAFAAARYLSGFDLPGSPVLPVLVGLAVVAMGIGPRAWAVLTLGASFRRVVTVQRDQSVVTEGPYRWMRHPSYSGALLAFLGIGITLGSWLSVASMLCFPLPGYLLRIRIEETELRTTLGLAYQEYAQYRARLIPGVW